MKLKIQTSILYFWENRSYANEEFKVLVKENGKIVRAVNSRTFMREYEKLANLQLRDQYRPKATKVMSATISDRIV